MELNHFSTHKHADGAPNFSIATVTIVNADFFFVAPHHSENTMIYFLK